MNIEILKELIIAWQDIHEFLDKLEKAGIELLDPPGHLWTALSEITNAIARYMPVYNDDDFLQYDGMDSFICEMLRKNMWGDIDIDETVEAITHFNYGN